MHRYGYVLISFTLLCLISILTPASAIGAVTPPWSTTFNCPDWTQSNGLGTNDVNCDGISGWGSWTCDNGDGTTMEAQITSAANNPGGDGGKGYRNYYGNGTANESGSLSVSFGTPQTEFWIRWYMKYPSTMQVPAFGKWLYFNMTAQHGSTIPEWSSGDTVRYRIYYGGSGDINAASGTGFTTTMGGPWGDDQWHYYEVHMKYNTAGNFDGIAEIWIDGKLKLSDKAVSFDDNVPITTGGWQDFIIMSNHHNIVTSTGRCVPVDIDDIAISTTGYIGPLPDTLAPSAPSGNQAN